MGLLSAYGMSDDQRAVLEGVVCFGWSLLQPSRLSEVRVSKLSFRSRARLGRRQSGAGQRRRPGIPGEGCRRSRDQAAAAGRLKTLAALVRDPLCGMLLDPQQAPAQLEQDGSLLHFCSRGCRDHYEQERAQRADAANHLNRTLMVRLPKSEQVR
jgi:YHS domain-containing protein